MASLARKFVPLADRILVKRIVPVTKTSSGIYLPDSAQKRENEGMCCRVY